MSRALIPTARLLAGLVLFSLTARAAENQPEAGMSVRDLSQEVSALQTLYQLQLSKQQLKALRILSGDTGDKTKATNTGKASDKVRKALIDLRKALIEGQEGEKITGLLEALDDAEKKDKPELHDDMEVTEEARSQAPRFVKLLTPRQLATYSGIIADEIDDPFELLQDALTKVRDLEDDEWKVVRGEVAEEVGRLLAGTDPEKSEEYGNKVIQLLIVARGLGAEEFRQQRPKLEEKARAIIAEVGPSDVIRNVVENHLAELLSNPRLISVLEARLK